MITALMDPSQFPNALQDQEAFDVSMAYVLDMLPERGRQENELTASLNAYAAGGAYAFPYMFDSATADADPGPGKLRLSSATQNASSALRIDVLTQGGVSIAGLFDALLAVTSSLKGAVRIVKAADPAKWILFDVSSVGTGAGYRNINLVYRAGSSASPFANGDGLMVYIDRNGDSGTVPGATELLANIPISANTVALNALNVFDSDHDFYFVTLDGVGFSGSGTPTLNLQLAVAGAIDSSASYATIALGSSAAVATGTAISLVNSAGITEISGVIEIGSVNYANRQKVVNSRLVAFASAQSNPYRSLVASGAFNKTTAVATGLSLTTSAGGQFNSGTVRIYGVRKA